MIYTVTLYRTRMEVEKETFTFNFSDYGKYPGLVLIVYNGGLKNSISFRSLIKRLKTVKPYMIRFQHNVLSIVYIDNGKVSKEFSYKAKIVRY